MEASRALHACSGRPQRGRTTQAKSIPWPKKGASPISGVSALAEGIILQAIEDLGDKVYRKKSLQFFRGRGFGIWADIAKLTGLQQIRLARLIASAEKVEGGVMQKHQASAH